MLPAYGNYGNPLDVTAGFSPDSLPVATKALIDDPNVGMLFISFPISYRRGGEGLQQGHGGLGQAQGDGGARRHLAAHSRHRAGRQRKPGGVLALVGPHAARDRALYPLRPLARAHARRRRSGAVSGHAQARQGRATGVAGQEDPVRRPASACPTASLPARRTTPSAIAERVGYPVALKAQAAALSHKTEAGGVMLNLADEAALRAAWATMQQNVEAAAPGVTLDGCLVERMSGKGLELMIGAKRDPAWGTVLLLGLGGIWVEALGDVRLLPVDADETQFVEALHKLRAAKLLAGFRGAPPVDIAAVAQAVLAIGQLMRTTPAHRRDRRQPADGARQGTRRHGARCADRRRMRRPASVRRHALSAFASLSSSLSQPMVARLVHSSLCIASKVNTIWTPCGVERSSTMWATP